jgi:DNA polymerase III subunit epsilon
MDFAVIDIETTGLKPHQHEILEVAIITKDRQYHVRVQPQFIEFADQKALEINGYAPEEWTGAIPPNLVAKETSELLHGKTIIAHNPHFDMSFLKELWEIHNCNPYIDYRYIDTIQLAREHLPKCPSLKLDIIREYLGWSRLGAHSALIDAKDTLRLYRTLWRCSWVKRKYFELRYKMLCWVGLIR